MIWFLLTIKRNFIYNFHDINTSPTKANKFPEREQHRISKNRPQQLVYDPIHVSYHDELAL